MALFKYFKVDKCVKEDNVVLLNPSGPLARTIPPSRIDAINDDIKPVVDTIMDKGKATRGTYEKFSSDEKARVAKRAAEHGVLSTVRHFAKIWPDRPLKEGTVRGWKNRYNREVSLLKRSGKEIVVRELIDKKKRPSTFARRRIGQTSLSLLD